jgi:hypothetical protein
MAKSRAVAVRTRYVSRPRRSYSRRRGVFGGKKIPVAVIAGAAPGVAWAIDSASQGNWQGAGERLLAAYTGYEWGYKKFTPFYLNKGLYPLIGGFVIHAAANYFGLNRMIAKFNLPVEI